MSTAETPGGSGLIACPHCGVQVPQGAFCGNCGAHLSGDMPAGKSRHFSYAAAPHEHVLRSAVITTLFPHLPHRQTHVFRELLLGAVVVIALLAALRLPAPAALVSILILPVLYLLYLYESEVYEDEPLVVLALTFVLGGILGYLYVQIANALTVVTAGGLTAEGPLVDGVLLPVVLQMFMLAGPLLLLTRRAFTETLDGLTFGVASALGFTLVSALTSSWSVFVAPFVHGVPTDDVLRAILNGVLAAVVNAGTTAVITTAIWFHRNKPANRAVPFWRTLPVAVLVGFAVQIVLGVVSYYMASLVGLVVLWVVAAAILLVAVRVELHLGLLDEAIEREAGPPTVCMECHRLVPSMAFCPNCGAARLAAPKHTRTTGGAVA